LVDEGDTGASAEPARALGAGAPSALAALAGTPGVRTASDAAIGW
jgi:hypothetical protein